MMFRAARSIETTTVARTSRIQVRMRENLNNYLLRAGCRFNTLSDRMCAAAEVQKPRLAASIWRPLPRESNRPLRTLGHDEEKAGKKNKGRGSSAAAGEVCLVLAIRAAACGTSFLRVPPASAAGFSAGAGRRRVRLRGPVDSAASAAVFAGIQHEAAGNVLLLLGDSLFVWADARGDSSGAAAGESFDDRAAVSSR